MWNIGSKKLNITNITMSVTRSLHFKDNVKTIVEWGDWIKLMFNNHIKVQNGVPPHWWRLRPSTLWILRLSDVSTCRHILAMSPSWWEVWEIPAILRSASRDSSICAGRGGGLAGWPQLKLHFIFRRRDAVNWTDKFFVTRTVTRSIFGRQNILIALD